MSNDGIISCYDPEEDFDRWIGANMTFWVRNQFFTNESSEYGIPPYLQDFVRDHMEMAETSVESWLLMEFGKYTYQIDVTIDIPDSSTIRVSSENTNNSDSESEQ